MNAESEGRVPGGATDANACLAAASSLHHHLVSTHWDGREVLVGPDPGIRFNVRAGRFLKSYASFLPWSDDLVYMQAQGYWILSNWLLYDLLADEQYRDLAMRTSESVLALQQDEGYWEYPNPEWRGRTATVEGSFASLGLLESFAREGNEAFLDGAKRWYRYMRDTIGFRRQTDPDMLAVNYFAHSSGDGGGVPNNSTMALWTAARLAQLAEDDSFTAECQPMLNFLAYAQQPDGELPYRLGGNEDKGLGYRIVGEDIKERIHYLCYQYNAFEFIDLVHYNDIVGDDSARPILEPLAKFLSTGLEGGVARYECSRRDPEFAYYTAAVAQALSQASDMGMVDARAAVDEAYRHTLELQKPDGSIRFHSRKNYRFLSDKRSYPRYLSMILYHLVLEAKRPHLAQ